MSRKTKSILQDDIFANCCTAPTLASLEYPMNFDVCEYLQPPLWHWLVVAY